MGHFFSSHTNDLNCEEWTIIRNYLPLSHKYKLFTLTQSSNHCNERMMLLSRYYFCYRLLIILRELYHCGHLTYLENISKSVTTVSMIHKVKQIFETQTDFVVDNLFFSKKRMLQKREPLLTEFIYFSNLHQDYPFIFEEVPYPEYNHAYFHTLEGICNIKKVYEWVMDVQRNAILWNHSMIKS